MNVKFWKILCFLMAIIIATVAVFPFRRNLVSLHIESGEIYKARSILSDLLRESPGDPRLRLLSSNLYYLEGKSEEAIGELECFLENNPGNVDLLMRLATFYEWERKSKKALTIWENLAEIAPGKAEIWERLIKYYRYFSFPKKESEAISRLQFVEQELPSKKKIHSDHLLDLIRHEMHALSAKRKDVNDDPNLDTLLSGLYVLKMMYEEGVDNVRETLKYMPEREEIVNRCFELFVRTNHAKRAIAFAENLDKEEDTGIRRRIQLLQIMRWGGTDENAVLLLAHLNQSCPDDEKLLFAMADTAEEIEDLKTAIYAYETLVHNNPQRRDMKKRLASLYLESGAPQKAYPLLKKIAEATKNRSDVKEMLAAASYTGDPAVQIEAAAVAGGLISDDPRIIRELADIYLAMENPREAYPLFRKLLIMSGKREDCLRMLQVSSYTDDSNVIKESLEEAFRLFPHDIVIVSKVAEGYLGLDQVARACEMYGRLVDLSGGEKKWVAAMIEVAGYTSQKDVMEEALKKALAVLPADREIVTLAGRIYVWLNMPDKAYELLKVMAEQSGGDRQAVEQMIEVAEATGRPERIREALYLAKELRPDDKDLMMKASAYLLTQTDEMVAELERLDTMGLISNEKRLALAQIYLDRKDGARAMRQLEIIKKTEKLSNNGSLMLASAYELLGKTDAATAIYFRLYKENPDSPKLLSLLGDRALGLGRTEGALLFYKGALKRDPKNLAALKGSGQIYGWNNNLDKAIKHLRAYNLINPFDYEAHYLLGELYFTSGRRSDALREYAKSEQLIKEVKAQRQESAPTLQ